MMGDIVGWFRRGGQSIPIRAAAGAAVRGGAAPRSRPSMALHYGRALQATSRSKSGSTGLKKLSGSDRTPSKIHVNRGLDLLGLGLSVASGAVGAATFSGSGTRFIGGALASHGIDIAGVAANAGSVAGHGKIKERARIGAKQEARNFVVGNAVYAAGILGSARNRQTLKVAFKKVGAFAAKHWKGFAKTAESL